MLGYQGPGKTRSDSASFPLMADNHTVIFGTSHSGISKEMVELQGLERTLAWKTGKETFSLVQGLRWYSKVSP